LGANRRQSTTSFEGLAEPPMINIKVVALPMRAYVLPGDTVNLVINDEVVSTENITQTKEITHYAFISIEGVGVSYFIGNDSIESFLRSRFPDANFSV
jgi:hypothetical protein